MVAMIKPKKLLYIAVGNNKNNNFFLYKYFIFSKKKIIRWCSTKSKTSIVEIEKIC